MIIDISYYFIKAASMLMMLTGLVWIYDFSIRIGQIFDRE